MNLTADPICALNVCNAKSSKPIFFRLRPGLEPMKLTSNSVWSLHIFKAKSSKPKRFSFETGSGTYEPHFEPCLITNCNTKELLAIKFFVYDRLLFCAPVLSNELITQTDLPSWTLFQWSVLSVTGSWLCLLCCSLVPSPAKLSKTHSHEQRERERQHAI
jgi:hypothetical protein